VCVCDVLMVCC